MKTWHCWFAVWAIIECGNPVHAATDSGVVVERIAGQWHLDARHADLPRLLDMVAERTGSKLHYSWLPAPEVTATCVAVDAAGLLKCLFGNSVNMAVRDLPLATGKTAAASEIWIMGSTLGAAKQAATSQCQSSVSAAAAEAPAKELAIATWLQQARSKNTGERLQAVSELARLNASSDDAAIRTALQNALADSDSRVKLQAIGGIASRDGEEAVMQPLAQILRNGNAELRLMALDYIETDQTLLQMAARDADQAVRDLASVKLEQLAQPDR
ncbi:hypothetical protein C2U68_06235 [Methylomonas koyamae]|nr:hypothetical protein C2U68_06235 [Methylomonas koyamae]